MLRRKTGNYLRKPGQGLNTTLTYEVRFEYLKLSEKRMLARIADKRIFGFSASAHRRIISERRLPSGPFRYRLALREQPYTAGAGH